VHAFDVISLSILLLNAAVQSKDSQPQ